MPGAQITIDLSGLGMVQDRLDKLAGIDYRRVLDTIGTVVEVQTRRRLGSEKTSPEGQRWQEWSSRYANSGRGRKKLERSSGLIDSLTHTVGHNKVEIGSNLVYAAIHQFGSGKEPVSVKAHQRKITQAFGKPLKEPKTANVKAHSFLQNIPARPYLGLSKDNENEIREVIKDWIEEILK